MTSSEVGSAAQPQALPTAGWYPDPARRWRLRWWDGARWTDAVSNGSSVAEEALPGAEPDGRARLPARAIWWAIGGIIVGEALGAVFALLGGLASHDRYVVELVTGQLGLWLGFAGAIWIVSKRYGSGRPFRDFGVRMRRSDVGWGVVWSLAARVGAVVVVLPLVLGFRHYFKHAPDTSPVEGHENDLGAKVTLSIIAALGAPFVEEMLFRGVILSSLRRFGVVWAVAGQAMLFGLVHLSPDQGRANYLTFLEITAVGVLLGILAVRTRRLVTGMWTHFFFNLQALPAIALS